jgi:hypothetical protein
MPKRIVVLSTLVFLTFGAAVGRADEAGNWRLVTVERATVGTLKAFNGVTGAPGAEFASPQDAAKTDISQAYQQTHIDLIRAHDAFGPTDIDAKFGAENNL